MIVNRENPDRIGERTHSFIQFLFQRPSTGDPEATDPVDVTEKKDLLKELFEASYKENLLGGINRPALWCRLRFPRLDCDERGTQCRGFAK